MKKIFKIPNKGNEFLIRISQPLVGNDVNSYVIQWELEKDMSGAQMVVSAKREDGEIVTDSAAVSGDVAAYTLKNNMYSVPGEVNIRIQIVKDGTMLTQCQIIFDALEGYEQSIEGDDRTPVLTTLILQAQEAANNANKAAGKVPTEVEEAVLLKGILASDSLIPESPTSKDAYLIEESINVLETKIYENATFSTNENYVDDISNYYGFASAINLLTEDELADYNECLGVEISVNVYDEEWQFVAEGIKITYSDGPGHWVTGDYEKFTVGKVYYLTRYDNVELVATEPVHEFGETVPEHLAVYDGEKWNYIQSGFYENAFTTEEKEKLAGLSNYDDTAIKKNINDLSIKHEELNEIVGNMSMSQNLMSEDIMSLGLNKVDVEEGKGLSTNDYTTEEKEKLAGLSNYDDTELKTAVATKADKTEVEKALKLKANLTDVEKSLSGKVDIEEGKGLSEANYTTEEKTKVLYLPDNFKQVESTEIDNLEDGVYLVHYPTEDGIFGQGVQEHYEILIQATTKLLHDDGSWSYHIGQTRYTTDQLDTKTDLPIAYRCRATDSYYVDDTWSEWENYRNVKIIDHLAATNADTALSANMGRVLNEKIGGKADIPNNYELVETITLTEDVTELNISTEPNGTPYNFDKFLVYVTVPKATFTESIRWLINGSLSCGSVNGAISANYESLSIYEVYCDKQINKWVIGRANFTNSWNNIGSMNYCYHPSSKGNFINRVRFFVNNNSIPAGSTFEIWGVRA